MYHEDGAYYWYGENKEYTDGKNSIWTWGIRMYRSTDLYNWEDLGLIAEPDLTNPDGNLFPEKYVDRPHIIKCATTGKYVMWVKISGAESCFTILQADKLTGPYTVVAEDYYPLGNSVGDFDMVVAEDGKAYLYVDTTPKRVAGFELAADYYSVTKDVTSQYENLTPPFCREGVTLFTHAGKKYLITSGTTGYTPNQSDAAASWLPTTMPHSTKPHPRKNRRLPPAPTWSAATQAAPPMYGCH